MTQNNRDFIKDLPIEDEENFKIYHDSASYKPKPSPSANNFQRKSSIYLTTPDVSDEPVRAIINEPKPQVTLKYLRVRSGQFGTQSSCDRNPAKRSKTNAFSSGGGGGTR